MGPIVFELEPFEVDESRLTSDRYFVDQAAPWLVGKLRTAPIWKIMRLSTFLLRDLRLGFSRGIQLPIRFSILLIECMQGQITSKITKFRFHTIFFSLWRMVLCSFLTFSSTPYNWAIYLPRGTLRGDANEDGVRGRGGRSSPNNILAKGRSKSLSVTVKTCFNRKCIPIGSLLQSPKYIESLGRAFWRLYMRRREPRRRGQVHGQATGKR